MTTAAPRTRGRRSTRPSGDDRELAILETAERLLGERPLAEISVDDLAKGAGLSRPTFYFYFPSKDAVLVTLLERVIAEADVALADLMANPPAERNAFWRAGIAVFYNAFSSHRALVAGGAVAKFTIPAVGEMWAAFMQRSIDHTTGVIEIFRARGDIPVNMPAEELSTALNLLNEAVMTSSFAGQKPTLDDDRVLDNLVHIWISAIYADAP